jgi:hypothetical protein
VITYELLVLLFLLSVVAACEVALDGDDAGDATKRLQILDAYLK